MLRATAFSLASVTSRPSTASVKCNAGENGANDTAIRTKENSSAGFRPVSASKSFSAPCKASSLHSTIPDNFAIQTFNSSSSSASLIFFRNLFPFSISMSIFGSVKKYSVILRKSPSTFSRSYTIESTRIRYSSSRSSATTGQNPRVRSYSAAHPCSSKIFRIHCPFSQSSFVSSYRAPELCTRASENRSASSVFE